MEILVKTSTEIRKRCVRMRPKQSRPIVLMVGVLLLTLVTIGYASDTKSASTWTDPGTGLTWATQDNGTDVDWKLSISYCADLQLGGYSNWRLPTIEGNCGDV